MQAKHANLGVPTAVAAGVCLVLAVLFLFNPYFTIYSSSSECAMHTPLSHRGTVGASELRRSLVSPEKISVRTVAVEVARVLLAEPIVAPQRPNGNDEPIWRPDQVQSASLWFRPPPVS